MCFLRRKLNIPTGLMRWKVEMKRLAFVSVIIALFTFDAKSYAREDIFKKWTEQRERRESLTKASRRLILDSDSAKSRCIQGRRLNEMFAISFWSFKAHDSRIEENWEIVKRIIDRLDERTKQNVLNDKEEQVIFLEAYEAGMLLAMRETCPDVW